MFTTVSRSVKRSSQSTNWSSRNLMNFAIVRGKEKDFCKLSLQLEGIKEKNKNNSVQELVADLRLPSHSSSLAKGFLVSTQKANFSSVRGTR